PASGFANVDTFTYHVREVDSGGGLVGTSTSATVNIAVTPDQNGNWFWPASSIAPNGSLATTPWPKFQDDLLNTGRAAAGKVRPLEPSLAVAWTTNVSPNGLAGSPALGTAAGAPAVFIQGVNYFRAVNAIDASPLWLNNALTAPTVQGTAYPTPA